MLPKTYGQRNLRWFFGATAMIIALAGCRTSIQVPTDRHGFDSPQQAVVSLVAAVQHDDDSVLLAILGPDAQDLITSGDPVADKNSRKRFLQVFAEKHRLDKDQAGKAVLIIGNKDYPFPIPLRQHGDVWVFDTSAGREEILNRRIGRNELHTIEVMRAYTAAQREYASNRHHKVNPTFAQKLTSSEGQRDGLYWPVAEGETESPFGLLIARATEEGYEDGLAENPPEPFHGYFFKILKAQGTHARGGAFNYVAGGRMVLGFAMVAYPAKYEASGIMTFIVNQEGVIYEKDLGEETADKALAMTDFDPDDSWQKYED
ncbi:hypothetical protein A7E78_11795 [Syntrophotalea acetylenivorans]|uniref:DUF2950 domain-containing protein n=2 Tax=Syntrophotalea acetylenivorans TaxID=1842532 RepID=A0A1L3GTB4_9BACT|nr:hypothetical protein A7E78_11795 [Syntrophotalea acetylenivorans]